jgi:hypothetical protein
MRAVLLCAGAPGQRAIPHTEILARTRYAVSGRFSFLHPLHGSICFGSYCFPPGLLKR